MLRPRFDDLTPTRHVICLDADCDDLDTESERLKGGFCRAIGI